MGWKTGTHTFAAHYITSLAKTAESVCRITDKHKPEIIAQNNAGKWLSDLAPPNVTVKAMMMTSQNKSPKGAKPNPTTMKLSVGQQCDEWYWQKLVPQLSDNELAHVLAHSGSTNWWVTCTPLEYKNWNILPAKWTAAVRRRLYLDVIPAEQQCSYCIGRDVILMATMLLCAALVHHARGDITR